MADAIAHRGPDGEGFWTTDRIGLAHRRLAIRDLTDAGKQPLHDPAGHAVVTFNGELYNDNALRRELSKKAGAVFKGHCDAEVLPTGFVHWGHRLPEQLEGIYAYAVWDGRRQELTLVRDPVGAKPLFYLHTDDALYFGSEIKAIIAGLDRCPTVDPRNLHRFLAQGYVSPAGTTLSGVKQVPPGTALTFGRDGSVSTNQFFTLSRSGDRDDQDTLVEEFRSLWEQVIDDQLISDVPLGVLQSGGIDSSLVSYGLRRHRQVPLFTATFSERSHDEADLARGVADATGHEQICIPVQTESGAAAAFEGMVRGFDGQVADNSAFAFYQLAQAVRQHVTVVLGGDGADEFFAGYSTYRASRLARLLSPFLPSGIGRPLARFFYSLDAKHESRLPAADLLFRFTSGIADGRGAAHVHWRRLVPDFMLGSLYGPELRRVAADDPFDHYAGEFRGAKGSVLDRAMLADQRFHLPAALLQKTDAMSMAHGLEVRVPFLDTRIIRFAERCHVNQLYPVLGNGKRLLRKALESYGAPSEVVRGSKRGFNVPIAQLLRGPLAGLADRYLTEEADRLEPYFDGGELRSLWRQHRERKANHAFALWPILVFASWMGSVAP